MSPHNSLSGKTLLSKCDYCAVVSKIACNSFDSGGYCWECYKNVGKKNARPPCRWTLAGNDRPKKENLNSVPAGDKSALWPAVPTGKQAALLEKTFGDLRPNQKKHVRPDGTPMNQSETAAEEPKMKRNRTSGVSGGRGKTNGDHQISGSIDDTEDQSMEVLPSRESARTRPGASNPNKLARRNSIETQTSTLQPGLSRHVRSSDEEPAPEKLNKREVKDRRDNQAAGQKSTSQRRPKEELAESRSESKIKRKNQDQIASTGKVKSARGQSDQRPHSEEESDKIKEGSKSPNHISDALPDSGASSVSKQVRDLPANLDVKFEDALASSGRLENGEVRYRQSNVSAKVALPKPPTVQQDVKEEEKGNRQQRKPKQHQPEPKEKSKPIGKKKKRVVDSSDEDESELSEEVAGPSQPRTSKPEHNDTHGTASVKAEVGHDVNPIEDHAAKAAQLKQTYLSDQTSPEVIKTDRIRDRDVEDRPRRGSNRRDRVEDEEWAEHPKGRKKPKTSRSDKIDHSESSRLKPSGQVRGNHTDGSDDEYDCSVQDRLHKSGTTTNVKDGRDKQGWKPQAGEKGRENRAKNEKDAKGRAKQLDQDASTARLPHSTRPGAGALGTEPLASATGSQTPLAAQKGPRVPIPKTAKAKDMLSSLFEGFSGGGSPSTTSNSHDSTRPIPQLTFQRDAATKAREELYASEPPLDIMAPARIIQNFEKKHPWSGVEGQHYASSVNPRSNTSIIAAILSMRNKGDGR